MEPSLRLLKLPKPLHSNSSGAETIIPRWEFSSPTLVGAFDGGQVLFLVSDPDNCTAESCALSALGTRYDGTPARIEPSVYIGSPARLLGPDSLQDSPRSVFTKDGITIREAQSNDANPDFQAYGVWMDHSGFGLQTGQEAELEIDGQMRTVTLTGIQHGGDPMNRAARNRGRCTRPDLDRFNSRNANNRGVCW